MSNIRTSLISVNFGISCWEARRQDKKASKEVADIHGTASTVGRYHKDLLPGAEEHENVLKIRNAWRVWHSENTLPWNDNGTRVMRSAAFMDYSEGYRAWKDKFETGLEVFYDAYPTLVAQSELKLNTMFDPAEYPSLEEVKRRFAARLDVYPLPSAEDFRILDGISPEDAEHLRTEALSGLEAQVTAATKDLWERMHTVVKAMAERLAVPHGEKGGKFHDSLTQNIEDLLVRVPALNLTGDAAITSLSDDMRKLLCAPQALRDNPDLRDEKAALAKALASRMAQYV